MEELLKDLENFNSSLTGKALQAAAASTNPFPDRASVFAPSVSQSMSTIARPAGAAPIAKPEARPLFAEHCEARAAELPSGA